MWRAPGNIVYRNNMGGNIVPGTSFFEGFDPPAESETQNTKLVFRRDVFFEGFDPPEASGTQNTKLVYLCMYLCIYLCV